MKKNILFVAIGVFYLATRLVNLKIIPIFTDEAIYSYWAQVAQNDSAHRFISMEDGKQPLFIWFGAVFQKIFADPLIAMRMVSVCAGLVSVFGIYLLAKLLFDKKVAVIAALLYIILPFSLLYDRMGIYDSLATVFGIYSLLFATKIARNPNLKFAILNGIIIGLGLINKSTTYFFLLLLPTSIIFFNFKTKAPTIIKKVKENLSAGLQKWLICCVITGVVAMGIYNTLRISPLFFRIGQKNLEFTRSVSEVIRNPLLHFNGNLNSIVNWAIDYNGILLLLLAATVAIWGVYKFNKSVIILLLYIIVPIAYILFFNKVLYSRFSLYSFPYLIILMAYGFSKIASFNKKLALVVFLILVAYPVVSSFHLLTDPPKSYITSADKNQFLNDWPAGYGVSEVVAVLREQSKNNKVYVGTEGTFGLLPYAFQIYFYGNNNVDVVGYWPVRDIPQQVLEAAKTRKTYFVFNENQSLSDNTLNPHLKLLAKYQKGTGISYMRLYEVLP